MKNVIYVVVGLLIIGGIGWLAVGKDMRKNAENEDNGVAQMSDRSSFRALLAQNRPQKCTFSDSTEAAETAGTVYVADGKMRGDFTATTDADVMASHMIVLDNTSYMWTEDMKEGFKISLEESQGLDAAQQDAAVDMNREVDYSCENWNADESLFSLPSDVTFQDMSEVMNSVMQGQDGNASIDASTSGSADECAACAQVPDAYRSQCLAAMNCTP